MVRRKYSSSERMREHGEEDQRSRNIDSIALDIAAPAQVELYFPHDGSKIINVKHRARARPKALAWTSVVLS